MRSLLLLLILVPVVMPGCCSHSMPSFERLVPSATFEAVGLPDLTFVMQHADAQSNGIHSVFVDPHRMHTDVTVVFEDEDQPLWQRVMLFGYIVEMLRHHKYKREADVETFRIVHSDADLREDDKGPGKIHYIHFDRTYAGRACFNGLALKHESATVPYSRFTRSDDSGSPRLYVATWNHMFHECMHNLEEDQVEHIVTGIDCPVYLGSRQVVEDCFR